MQLYSRDMEKLNVGDRVAVDVSMKRSSLCRFVFGEVSRRTATMVTVTAGKAEEAVAYHFSTKTGSQIRKQNSWDDCSLWTAQGANEYIEREKRMQEERYFRGDIKTALRALVEGFDFDKLSAALRELADKVDAHNKE